LQRRHDTRRGALAVVLNVAFEFFAEILTVTRSLSLGYTILEPPVFAAIRFNQEIQTTTISQLVRLIFRFGGVHLPGV